MKINPSRHILSRASLFCAAAMTTLLCVAAPARAGFSSISTPPTREQDQAQILSHAYGGTFTPSGNNFTNGTITAVRVDDSADQTWSDGGTWNVRTLAAF